MWNILTEVEKFYNKTNQMP